MISTSAVGQFYEGILNFLVYPANVKLRFILFEKTKQGKPKVKPQTIEFDIMDTQYILQSTSTITIKQSLWLFFKSAKHYSGKYVAGIPVSKQNFFYDFAIARYNPKSPSNNNERLQLWFIDYTCGSIKSKGIKKSTDIKEFIKLFEKFNSEADE